MKRTTLTSLALGAALVVAGSFVAPNRLAAASSSTSTTTSAPAAAPAAAAKPQKLVKIRSLDTVKDNDQFQANVQVLQAQRQKAVELSGQIERETDATKKKDLQKELDTLMAKLNENNQAMTKAYGFSLTRNYTIEIEKSNIYMLVTDEEAAQIEKAQKEANEKAEKEKKAKK